MLFQICIFQLLVHDSLLLNLLFLFLFLFEPFLLASFGNSTEHHHYSQSVKPKQVQIRAIDATLDYLFLFYFTLLQMERFV